MVIGGGHCSDTGATAFNGSYVGTVRSGAFGQKRSEVKWESSHSIPKAGIVKRFSGKFADKTEIRFQCFCAPHIVAFLCQPHDALNGCAPRQQVVRQILPE